MGVLPEGARLLHIGFPKSGTTALQGALRDGRRAARGQGVVYPGKHRAHHPAAVAAIGAVPRIGEPGPDPRRWELLVDQVERAGDRRVIVSSEFFCEADAAAVDRVVAALGGDSVHVLATMRPLAKILPSSWQQYVQNGQRSSYEDWLDAMLRKPPYERPTPSFWRRQRHDAVLERWASAVGPQRVTAIVVDEADPERLLRQVEQMTGLSAGTLVMPPNANRSLTHAEAELVRHLNVAYKSSPAWPEALYRQVVREAVADQLIARPGSGRIATPDWARERAAELGAQMAAAIAAAGIEIVGDVDALSRLTDAASDGEESPGLAADVAAAVMVSAIDAARRYGRAEGRTPVRRLLHDAIAQAPHRLVAVKLFARRMTRGFRG